MKKRLLKNLLAGLAAAIVATAASAGNFVSVDVDAVKDTKSKAVSTAQYVRAGYDTMGLNLGLQVRTAVFEKGGMLNSTEGTAGKTLGPLSVYAGAGYDNGWNGGAGKAYQYGLVGATLGAPIGPFYGYSGVKTRINWEKANPEQTVAFAGLSYPLTKHVSVNAGVSASRQDIKENAWGLGARVTF
jgi:hypothetical protein